MTRYEYTVVSIKKSMWTGKSKADYLEIINEYGAQGWKFVMFADKYASKKPTTRIELVFERTY